MYSFFFQSEAVEVRGDVVIDLDPDSPLQSLSQYLCDRSFLLRCGCSLSSFLPMVGLNDIGMFRHFVVAVQSISHKRQRARREREREKDGGEDGGDGGRLPGVLLVLDDDEDLEWTLEWMQLLAGRAVEEVGEVEEVEESQSVVTVISASNYRYYHRETTSSAQNELCVRRVVPVATGTDSSSLKYGVLHLPNMIKLVKKNIQVEVEEGDDGSGEGRNCSSRRRCSIPPLTSFTSYLNGCLKEEKEEKESSSVALYESVGERRGRQPTTTTTTTTTTNELPMLDEDEVRHVLATVGASYNALSSFQQQRRSAVSSVQACDLALNAVPLVEQLFGGTRERKRRGDNGGDNEGEEAGGMEVAAKKEMGTEMNIEDNSAMLKDTADDDDDDMHARCQYKLLSSVTADNITTGGLPQSTSNNVTILHGDILMKNIFDSSSLEFFKSVERLGHLQLVMPSRLTSRVLSSSWRDPGEMATAAAAAAAATEEEEMEIEEEMKEEIANGVSLQPLQYFPVTDCSFSIDWLWSNAFLKYTSPENRDPFSTTTSSTSATSSTSTTSLSSSSLPDMIARLDALVRLDHLKRDVVLAKEERKELLSDMLLTKRAWEKAQLLYENKTIDEDELLHVVRNFLSIIFDLSDVIFKYTFERPLTFISASIIVSFIFRGYIIFSS